MNTSPSTAIIEGYTNAYVFASEYFNVEIDHIGDLAPYAPLIATLRGLPLDTLREEVAPVLDAQFKLLGLNPKDQKDRETGADFVVVFMQSSQDLMQLMSRAMEEQRTKMDRIAKGRLLNL